MKRIIYLIGIVIGLCLTSSCGKDFLDQMFLEGTWGLTSFSMSTNNSLGGEDLLTEYDPFHPKDEMDTRLTIINTRDNNYFFTEERWNPVLDRWTLFSENTIIVRNDVLFILENGREVEFGRFKCSLSTLTIETISVSIESTTRSVSTYRRMSE